MSREEDAYVIERMGKLLAEIAIIVNGTEPHDTLWSYHDLPEKVRALKQAQQPAAAVPIAWIHAGDVESQRQNPDNVAYVLAKPSHGYVPLYAAPPAAAVPEGYALVPVEPTKVMLDAGHAAAWSFIPSCFDMTDAEIVYRAMLAASRKETP